MENRFLPEEAITSLAKEHGTPLLVVDCEQLRRQFRALSSALPGVDFYYAVKAFPQPEVLRTFNQLGAGFDIASSGEIELLRSLHINPRRSIHTHPVKSRREIMASLRFGCTTFVIDNPGELDKFREFRHRVGLILRVSFRGESAVVDLSRKFGCHYEDAADLLNRARSLGIHVKGISFHVGSQSITPEAHVDAIRKCNSLIREHNEAQADSLISVLDIGGGFPVSYTTPVPCITEFCQPIVKELSKLPADLEVIAEPGRFLVAPAAISIASVVGKALRSGTRWYYLDDGVYGNYSGIIYDHACYPIHTLKGGDVAPCVLAGPTCDSIDVIAENLQLPELEEGDLVIGEVMGAYTAATSSEFNSLKKSTVLVLNLDEASSEIPYIA